MYIPSLLFKLTPRKPVLALRRGCRPDSPIAASPERARLAAGTGSAAEAARLRLAAAAGAEGVDAIDLVQGRGGWRPGPSASPLAPAPPAAAPHVREPAARVSTSRALGVGAVCGAQRAQWH
jgi:hypothetical protein